MRKKVQLQSPLDHEEKEILRSFEKGEWHAVKNIENEKHKPAKLPLQPYAKKMRINIISRLFHYPYSLR